MDTLLDEEKKFRFLAKAEEADRILFVREDYDEFPDLWVGDLDFGNARKVTDVNPGLLDRFAWGTSELVEWTSDDGVPLQGVVIKPGNYEPGKRYPVLTYFYRFFSQRLHEFNAPVVNHRPSFPIYASDGYVVFLPDVRFEVGRPGISSLKSVVPGLKKLVEMGLADPNALGLHGHSWSGYTTAYIVTQTNIFAAAVAGAPVSNMTSAYGGIRWGTGLARQFQYEAGQSRLSGSLWEARPDYIENSPLFYADRVETPLVLMHGDEDDAVPWYQSIEFYLALRRTGKHAVFLQYRGEPHHPQKYPNKLDYSIKMKEFFDHYLKGGPAPDWWATGVPVFREIDTNHRPDRDVMDVGPADIQLGPFSSDQKAESRQRSREGQDGQDAGMSPNRTQDLSARLSPGESSGRWPSALPIPRSLDQPVFQKER